MNSSVFIVVPVLDLDPLDVCIPLDISTITPCRETSTEVVTLSGISHSGTFLGSTEESRRYSRIRSERPSLGTLISYTKSRLE